MQVLNLNRRLCAELTPHAMALIDAFGLSQDVLAAPIAGDWVGYNDGDNQGELGTKKEFLEVLKKATEASDKLFKQRIDDTSVALQASLNAVFTVLKR